MQPGAGPQHPEAQHWNGENQSHHGTAGDCRPREGFASREVVPQREQQRRQNGTCPDGHAVLDQQGQQKSSKQPFFDHGSYQNEVQPVVRTVRSLGDCRPNCSDHCSADEQGKCEPPPLPPIRKDQTREQQRHRAAGSKRDRLGVQRPDASVARRVNHHINALRQQRPDLGQCCPQLRRVLCRIAEHFCAAGGTDSRQNRVGARAAAGTRAVQRVDRTKIAGKDDSNLRERWRSDHSKTRPVLKPTRQERYENKESQGRNCGPGHCM